MEYQRAKSLLLDILENQNAAVFYNPLLNNTDNIEPDILAFWSKFIIDWGNRYHVISFNIRKLEECIALDGNIPNLYKIIEKLCKSKTLESASAFMKAKKSFVASLITSVLCADRNAIDSSNTDYIFKNVLKTTAETIRMTTLSKAISSVDCIISDEEIINSFAISSMPILSKYLTDNNLAVRLSLSGFYIINPTFEQLPSNQVTAILSLKKAVGQTEKYMDELSNMIYEAEKDGNDTSTYVRRRELSSTILHGAKRTLESIRLITITDSVIREINGHAISLQDFICRNNESTAAKYVEVKYRGIEDTPEPVKPPRATINIQHSPENSISYPSITDTPPPPVVPAGRFASAMKPSQPTGKSVMSKMFLEDDKGKTPEISSKSFYGRMPNKSLL